MAGTAAGIDAAFGGPGIGGQADPTEAAVMKQEAMFRAMHLPEAHTVDANGDVHVMFGSHQTRVIPGAGKPMAGGGEAAILSQVKDVMAADPTVSVEDATQRVRAAALRTVQNTQATTANRAVTTGAAAAVAPEMNQQRLASIRQRVVNEQTALPGIQMSVEAKQRALNGQLTAAEAAHTAATFLANHPGATSDDFNDMVSALSGGIAGSTPTAPAAAAPPPPGPGGAASPVAVGAATPPPGATPPVATAPAVKPGLPSGRSLYKPNASEQGALDTMAAAAPMMQRVRALLAGHESENSWGNTFQGVKAEAQSMVGHNPSNPMYAQLDPLIQHLKVFALGPYLHGIRNGAFVKAVSDNTPTITDTPARIIQKLDNLEQNFKDITAAIGAQQPGANGKAGAPVSAAPPSGGPPVGTQRVIKGTPAHWDGAGWVPDQAQ
jgi:hypothetical protein